MPSEAEQIMQWLDRLQLPLEYKGEVLANISQKVLLHLLKHGKERLYLIGEQKAELLERYDFACAHCGAKGFLEWDHIEPLKENYGAQNFQPLCTSCHALKTQSEPKALEADILASHFERSVWEAYVLQDRPPALVYKAKKIQNLSGFEIADVIRCRKRALEFNTHEVPIFSPLGAIQECKNTRGIWTLSTSPTEAS